MGVLTGAIGGLGVVLALLATAVGVDVMLGRYLIASLVPLAIAVAVGFGMWGSGVAAGTRPSVGAASVGDRSNRPLGPSGGLLGAAGETTVTETGGRPLEPGASDAPAGPGIGGRSIAVGTSDRSIAPGASDGPTGPGIGSRRGLAFLAGLVGIGVLCVVSLVAVVAVARDPELQRTEWRQVAEAVAAGKPGEVGTGAAAGEGSRVLVVNLHGTMAQPLLHYVDGSRRLEGEATVQVEAVDVLAANGTDRPCNLLVGRGCGLIFLGAPPPEPLAGQLDLVERVELDQFTVDRYRADAPVTVSRDDLVGPADRPSALVLVVP